jgi:hypothetical protein
MKYSAVVMTLEFGIAINLKTFLIHKLAYHNFALLIMEKLYLLELETTTSQVPLSFIK